MQRHRLKASCDHYPADLFTILILDAGVTIPDVIKQNPGDNPIWQNPILVVAFAKCQRKKKNLPTSPVLVPMFIKPFQLLRREFPLQALLVPTFLPCSWP